MLYILISFSSGLILGGHECLCATSQKRHLTRVILFTVNYCLFANVDFSIRFKGKDDNAVFEFLISLLNRSNTTRDLICVGRSVRSVSLRFVMCLALKLSLNPIHFVSDKALVGVNKSRMRYRQVACGAI